MDKITDNAFQSLSIVDGSAAASDDFDVTLRGCDGVSVRAHRWVLRRRSKYFDSMFRSGPADAEPHFGEISGAVLGKVVEFFYKGALEAPPDLLDSITRAGDYFESQELVEYCEIKICRRLIEEKKKNLSEENIFSVVESFMLACQLNLYRLKEYAKETLVRHLHKPRILSKLTREFQDYRYVEDLCRLFGINVAVKLKKETKFFEDEFWWMMIEGFKFVDSRLRIALSLQENLRGIEAYELYLNHESDRSTLRSQFQMRPKAEKRENCLYDPLSRKVVEVIEEKESSNSFRFKCRDTGEKDFVGAEFRVSFPEIDSDPKIEHVSLFGNYAFVVTHRTIVVFSLIERRILRTFHIDEMLGNPFDLRVVWMSIRGGLAILYVKATFGGAQEAERPYNFVFYFDASDPEMVRYISRWSCSRTTRFALDFFDRLVKREDDSHCLVYQRYLSPEVTPFEISKSFHPIRIKLGRGYFWCKDCDNILAYDGLESTVGAFKLPALQFGLRRFAVLPGPDDLLAIIYVYDNSIAWVVSDLKKDLKWSEKLTIDNYYKVVRMKIPVMKSSRISKLPFVGAEAAHFYGDEVVIQANSEFFSFVVIREQLSRCA